MGITLYGGSLGKQPKDFTLVLGGGGVRALAHIGVLKILEERNIPIGRIVATSAGAIVGAMYALEPNAALVEEKLRAFLISKTYKDIEELFQSTLSGTGGDIRSQPRLFLRAKRFLLASKAAMSLGIFEVKVLQTIVDSLLEDVPISACRIPFAAVAVNLHSGQPTTFNDGALRCAVIASCAIPGFFSPQNIEGSAFTDGGSVSPVPVLEALHLDNGKRPIIAVDVGRDIESHTRISNALDVVLRNESIAGYWLKKPHLKKAAVVIDPDVGKHTWSQAAKMDALIEAGKTAARDMIPKIERVQRERKRGFLKRLFS